METQIICSLLCFLLAVSSTQGWYTTQNSWLETTTGSCMYNCGHYVSGCSCTSDCYYYGNCCPDYNDFCGYWTTEWPHYETTSYSNCGGVLSGSSGSFSSPNYPGNYYNFEYCTWQITVPYGQRIILAFTQFQLELGCCGCDNVAVYDGPSTNYPSLGVFCQNSAIGRPIRSTSSYMTVVFRTDSSVTNQGFHAVYNTGQESCRYNCGYSHRNCSCSSYCQSNGNCCPDYCDYCSNYNFEYCYSTSTPETTTSSYPSCRYNCGYYVGSCSCSSNCIYQGNCCPDYYDYCSTTSTPASSCGGYLSGSGSIYSPYYPNYYPDHSYCVWHLSAPSGQTVFLTFYEISLENCCQCDYIAVYDGSSTNSPLLGKVCYNGTTSGFHSSSRYMTVVFSSDYSGMDRGFYATFSSSLPETSGKVDCSSDNINIILYSSYLNSMGYSGYDLYLNDQRCRPRVSSYEVVFSFPPNTCGTEKKFSNGKVVYSNDVRAYTSNGGEITNQGNFQLHVGCYMNQDTTAHIMYQAWENITSSISGTGRYNATMTFYTSSSYATPVYDNPYIVTLNQYMYVQVQLYRSEYGLVLSVDSCVASPSPHDYSTRFYELVRNGCGVDSTYYSYTNGDASVARFRFKAFKFLRSNPTVYLQCRVIVCIANDANSRCSPTCRSRKARSLNSGDDDSTTLMLGPIQLRGIEKAEKKNPEKDVAETED